MPGHPSLTIRPLTAADIPAALRLSTQAGWNQIGEDWQRLIDLWPDNCLGGWLGRDLIGTATLANYSNRIGWVGMILVDSAARGQGFGTALFRAALNCAEELGLQCVGLDATDLGKPLYLKHGFCEVVGIDRWTGPAVMLEDAGIEPAVNFQRDLPESLMNLDREAVGVDRSGLFWRLQREAGSLCRCISNDGQPIAWGMARRGLCHLSIGPVIAISGTAAASVVAALLSDIARSDSAASVCVDVPRGSPLAGMLPGWGFAVQRRLSRMSRPHVGTPLLAGPLIAAAAGLELG